MANPNSFSPRGQAVQWTSLGLRPGAATSSGCTLEMHRRDCWRRRLSNAELTSSQEQSCKSRRVHNSRAKISARFTSALLGSFICLAFITCHNARRQAAEDAASKPVLSATPNPVPTGGLDKPLGRTTITWDTGNGTAGDLYVKVDRDPEKFIARAPSGRREVRWIHFDSIYEFRLYNQKHSKLLATLTVTRDD